MKTEKLFSQFSLWIVNFYPILHFLPLFYDLSDIYI